MNVRGIKQAAQPTPRYYDRGTQTDEDRNLIAEKWEQQLLATYPYLAQTPRTVNILAAFMADKFFTVESLNLAVEDLRPQLDWLEAPKPKERTITEKMKRETMPFFDIASNSRNAVDAANKKAEAERAAELAKQRAEREALIASRRPNNPEPKRMLASGEGIRGGRFSTGSNADLPDQPTLAQFKAASANAKLRWMKKHPGYDWRAK